MPVVILPLDLFPVNLHCAHFTEVQNAGEIRASLPQHEGIVIINSRLICDVFLLVTAACKALYNQRLGQMRCRTLQIEFLYRLSPSTNVLQVYDYAFIGDRVLKDIRCFG